ncbi:hypothetical protein MPSEU_001021300 [Mayamaea pseudoterrestris]|nr:hypothetical protein MPSEU_001021300 [Mayamaea pseudoterrestris]
MHTMAATPDNVASAGCNQSPVLGMLLDTTSFDETDDFGVDTGMIKSEIWDELSQSLGGSAPVMMSNGRVRRRLRWKPRSMMRKNKQCASTNPQPAACSQGRVSRGRASSGASLNSCSNGSFASRFSKRSEHSFTSMETQLKNNTTKAMLAKQPHRLPVNSPSFETHSSMTIDGGGPAAAFVRQVSELSASTLGHKMSTDGSLALSRVPSTDSTCSSLSGRRGFPPLFKKGVAVRRLSGRKQSTTVYRDDVSECGSEATPVFTSVQSLSTTKEASQHSLSADAQRVQGAHSMEKAGIAMGRQSSTTSQSSVQEMLPCLSAEDVERERQIELRIRKTGFERRLSFGRNRNRTTAKVAAASQFQSGGVSTAEVMKDQESEIGLSHPTATKHNSKNGLIARSLLSNDQATSLLQSPVCQSLPVVDEDKREDSEMGFSLPDIENDARESVGPIFELPSTPRRALSPSTIEMGPGGKPMLTVPVDLDDGTFLEAEKNLKAIHQMASEHLNQREFTEALEVFEEILRGQLARHGEKHYRIGTALHNIGIVHMRRGDYLKAIDVYQDAIAIRKLTLPADHPDIAVSLAQLGVAYLETHQHKNAIAVFREALKIRREFYGPVHPKVAKILNNIGCALFELNEVAVAKIAFDEALQIQRYNLKRLPVSSNEISNLALLSVASTLSNIGSIHLFMGSFDEAAAVLKEALHIQQCIYGEGHPIACQTEESLRWIEQTPKLNPLSLNVFSFFSQVAKAFTMARTDFESPTSRAISSSSNFKDTKRLAPLSNSLLEAVEQKLANGMQISCGELPGPYDEEHELISRYSV